MTMSASTRAAAVRDGAQGSHANGVAAVSHAEGSGRIAQEPSEAMPVVWRATDYPAVAWRRPSKKDDCVR